MLTGAPPPAQAHNGVGAFFKGHAGSYIIYAYDGYPLPHNGLEYRLVLLNRRTGEPAEDFTIRISAAQPGAATRLATSHVYANVVFYDLPNPYPRDWRVTVRLDGHDGHAAVSFRTHGYQPQPAGPAAIYTVASKTNWPAIGGAAAGVTVLTAGVLALLLRRRRQ